MEEVDKMSHRLKTCGAAAVLLLLLTLLSSCGQPTVPDETATDYNQYIPSHGVTAYTKDLYIFFDSGRLFYVGRSQPSQLFPLCFQADCDHKNSSCTAWLNTPSRSIYAAGDNLYYIDADKDAKPALYRMDLSGGGRELVKSLKILNEESWPGISSLGYSFRVYGSYLAIELNLLNEDSWQHKIYLTGIDGKDEGIFLFGEEDDSDKSYIAIEFRENWLFVTEKSAADGTNTLWGYNFSTQEAVPLVEDWDISNCFTVQDGILYWAVTGDGVYSMDMEKKSVTKHRSFDPVSEYGAAAYDDQYLYLTNAIRYMDSQGKVPAEERGVKVYDLQGNLQQFIPVPQESGNALLLLFTPDYVFFCDDRNGSYCPTLYLEKAAVSSGTAQILPVG